MKELMKKYKEVELKRNTIAAKNSEAREKLRALKADDDRHEQAIKEIQKARQDTLYADLGELQKKIEIHKKAQEKLSDSIGDAEYAFSVCKRQLITLDSEMVGIKRQVFHAVADDLRGSFPVQAKTALLEICTAIQLSGLRPSPADVFNFLFGKGWDFGSMRDCELSIMKKYNLI